MSLQELFEENKNKYKKLVGIRKHITDEKGISCPKCKNESAIDTLRKKNYTCNYCGYLFKMPPRDRIEMISEAFREYRPNLVSKNPIDFPDYEEKLSGLMEKTGETEAVVTGIATIKNLHFALAVMNSEFLMGSMGTVVGEKITALAEYAERKKLPLVIFAASGGARMQEGLFSLMQMAQTSAAIEKF